MYNSMSDTPENWIQLNSFFRIAMRLEDGQDVNPVQEQEGHIGAWTIRSARGYNGIFAVDGDIEEGIKNVVEITESSTYVDLQNEIVHYLEREHGLTVMSARLRGHSQSEWMDTILWTKSDPELGGEPAALAQLNGTRQELQCWFAGDVYSLTVEELVTYHGPDGKTIERWETAETVDAVHGNYFDAGYATISDVLDRLEINPEDYGTNEKALELAN
jgi:hypothetical protein